MSERTNSLGQPISFALSDWTPPPTPPRECMDGRFCRLEPLQVDSHLDDLYQANAFDAEGKNWTYLAYGPFSDKDSYRDWMNKTCLGADPLFFAIVDKSVESACGVASYLNIAPASGAIEVGHIHYSPRLQRTPLTTEAMYLMMKKAFELGYRRYSWKCDRLNQASRAAAQRLGFSFEGIFRQATVYNGRNRDTAWYAAIDAEWPELEQAFLIWLAPDNFDDQGEQRLRLSDLTRPILKNKGNNR